MPPPDGGGFVVEPPDGGGFVVEPPDGGGFVVPEDLQFLPHLFPSLLTPEGLNVPAGTQPFG